MDGEMHERIPATTLALEVTGPGVPRLSLGEVLAGGPTLLVFLRHFG
jgi:hypothetical protein